MTECAKREKENYKKKSTRGDKGVRGIPDIARSHYVNCTSVFPTKCTIVLSISRNTIIVSGSIWCLC